MSASPTLVTGAAGFIGMYVARRLLQAGVPVVGLDSLNDYYDPALKQARLAELTALPGFAFEHLDLADTGAVDALFARHRFDQVVHLAAQPGVRYALDHPYKYSDANLVGATAVLEGCRRHGVKHLVFASSSSVYGGNTKVPFAESDPVDHPVSFYAATKRANELMAHSYAHLFGLPVTMLRFFTVYGPWGRPDMAVWKFTAALFDGRPIDVYAGGTLSRDFTFVEDVAEAVIRVLPRPPAQPGATDPAHWGAAGPQTSWAPFEIYNVGRSDPVEVNTLIALLEQATGRPALRRELPLQPGDVGRTFADPSRLRAAIGWEPQVPLADGLARFVRWYDGWRARR